MIRARIYAYSALANLLAATVFLMLAARDQSPVYFGLFLMLLTLTAVYTKLARR